MIRSPFPTKPMLVVPVLVLTLALGTGCSSSTEPEPEPPTLAGAQPDSGGVGTLVEITGTNFQAGAMVRFGPHPALGVERVSSTTLLAYAADSVKAGQTYDIVAGNPGSETVTLEGAFRGVAPELRVVNGVSRPSGQNGSLVILEGRAFGDLLGKGHVYFTDDGGQPVEATVDLEDNWTNEFVVATVPGSAASGPVWIETPTGTTESVHFTITQSATFSPSAINWTPTTPLPAATQGHAAVFFPIETTGFTGNLIFVTGGADGAMTPSASVSYADASGAGDLTAWTSGVDMPAPRAFHRSVVATPFNAFVDTVSAGHLYVLGGVDTTGVATSTVFRASVGPGGTIGGWDELTPLPEPLHSMGATIFRSWIYVAGGATASDDPVAGVRRAHVEFDGTIGEWEEQSELPMPRAYAPLVQFAGALYVVGGDGSAVAPGVTTQTGTRLASIVYNRLNLRTAELDGASWTPNSSTLIKPVAKHSVIVAGATMLVSGGLYNGAGNSATEHQYGEIGVDYSIGSFNGATGSQTIAGSSGAGGTPFFNHAAISYVDAFGEAHVIILGGADVNDGGVVIAETYYY